MTAGILIQGRLQKAQYIEGGVRWTCYGSICPAAAVILSAWAVVQEPA